MTNVTLCEPESGSQVGPSTAQLRHMHLVMVRIRRFEERAIQLFMAQEMPGFLHSYLGQEAVAAGVCETLSRRDFITSTHRGHGHVIAKGLRLDRMMAELFGKKTGYCKGKGGSMHITDFSCGVLGANGIVGGGIPIATGAALAEKLGGTGHVVVTFFGDGAINQGSFHESANMAAVWELPVVFVCENNLYAVSTHQRRHTRLTDLAERAKAFGFPGTVVDGNDPVAVYQAASEAVERARCGDGPTLIECKTYKWMGHYIGDPGTYRPAEEVEEWKAKDPLPRFEKYLCERGVVSAQEMAAVREQVERELEEAVEFAHQSPSPLAEEALEDFQA
jgi:acetoin:2,6-dichlorophenolindophenol oxidoreductase subunit alpha